MCGIISLKDNSEKKRHYKGPFCRGFTKTHLMIIRQLQRKQRYLRGTEYNNWLIWLRRRDPMGEERVEEPPGWEDRKIHYGEESLMLEWGENTRGWKVEKQQREAEDTVSSGRSGNVDSLRRNFSRAHWMSSQDSRSASFNLLPRRRVSHVSGSREPRHNKQRDDEVPMR